MNARTCVSHRLTGHRNTRCTQRLQDTSLLFEVFHSHFAQIQTRLSTAAVPSLLEGVLGHAPSQVFLFIFYFFFPFEILPNEPDL